MGVKKTIARLEDALSKVDQLREEARETTTELEDFWATCKISEKRIRSLNAAQANLADDFEVVYEIL